MIKENLEYGLILPLNDTRCQVYSYSINSFKKRSISFTISPQSRPRFTPTPKSDSQPGRCVASSVINRLDPPPRLPLPTPVRPLTGMHSGPVSLARPIQKIPRSPHPGHALIHQPGPTRLPRDSPGRSGRGPGSGLTARLGHPPGRPRQAPVFWFSKSLGERGERGESFLYSYLFYYLSPFSKVETDYRNSRLLRL